MSTGSLGENNIVRGEHIGVVTATQDGTICTVDENSCKMFGYTNPLDLVGRNVSVLIPPPYKEQHDSYIKNFLTTGVKKIIGKERLVEGYHLEKGKFPLMLNISTVMHGPSIQFVASMQPVSMNSVEMLVSKEGTILSVKNASCLGYEENAMLGHNISLLVPSPWKEKHDSYLAAYVPGSNSSRVVGQVRNMSVQTATHIAQATLTVTEQLQQGRLVFSCLIEHIDYSVQLVFTLLKNGQIKSCNKAFVSGLIGYSHEELVGRSINDIVPGLFVMGEDKELKASFLESRTSCEAVHRDGSTMSVFISLFAFNTTTGEVRYSCRLQRLPSSSTSQQGSSSKQEEKVMNKNGVERSDMQRLRREISIMESLNHPGIVRLYRVIETDMVVALVLEFMPGGELCDLIKLHHSLPEHIARRFFVQLLHAIHYLHSQGYVHRDIKCKNIMLSGEDSMEEQNVKLIDFGLSNQIQSGSKQNTFCGTPAYTAPEMILGQSYSGPEVDMWSLGVVLYLMLVGNFPFANVSTIISGSFVLQTWFSPSLCALFRGMFDISQTNRMKISVALAHPWTTQSPSGENSEATETRYVSCVVVDPYNQSSFLAIEELDDDWQPLEKRIKH